MTARMFQLDKDPRFKIMCWFTSQLLLKLAYLIVMQIHHAKRSEAMLTYLA
jgi:hypothetical protein